MANENVRLKTLGTFLKSRRNRLKPEQVGLAIPYGRRRTPGLRREEVAMIAGVSATYYTWLEQGREVTASREVIDNIGRALQLTQDEKNHLIGLWNSHEPASTDSFSTKLDPQWQIIIDQLSYPSFVTNERCEVLAWNKAANEIIADFSSLPVEERVMIRLLFVDQKLRSRMLNWEEFALYSISVFRTYYDKYAGDPWFETIVERLCTENAEFEAMWKLHHIELKKVSRVSIIHPVSGDNFIYDIRSLTGVGDEVGLHFCVYAQVGEENV